MVILEDTRQQAQKHELKHEYFDSNGIEYVRTKLPFGDYAIWGHLTSVDTKADVEEIAQNIGADHKRFMKEVKLSIKLGGHLIFLIENVHGYRCIEDVKAWVNPNMHKTARSMEGPRLAKAMETISDRYGVQFEFCAPEEAGRRVIELLEADDGE